MLPSLRPMAALACGLLLALSACSSSIGGGSSPPAQNTVVLPPGAHLVCSDGTAPPCH